MRQNALGTMQKFSLRRKPQSLMIEQDMIKWISNVLKAEADTLSDYSIEYATALLMNLSLRGAGKDKCEDQQIDLLKVLNELVEHENLQVRTYVNGTLYSIFTRKKLREEAKTLGMPEVLQYLMQHSDEQFKRQIQYILDQLNTDTGDQGAEEASTQLSAQNDEEEDVDEDEEEEDDDEEEEEEIVEEEDGEFNDIIDQHGIMIGEEWLVNEFLAEPDDAQQQASTVAQLMDRDRQRLRTQNDASKTNLDHSAEHTHLHLPADGRPPIRPITPIKSSQTHRHHHGDKSSISDSSTFTTKVPAHQQIPTQGYGATNVPEGKEAVFDETDRNLPSELQSRPKIPRTPLDG